MRIPHWRSVWSPQFLLRDEHVVSVDTFMYARGHSHIHIRDSKKLRYHYIYIHLHTYRATSRADSSPVTPNFFLCSIAHSRTLTTTRTHQLHIAVCASIVMLTFCVPSHRFAFYLFSVAASGVWLNWALLGAVQLLLLFQGSTNLTEELSVAKYPLYKQYQRSTSRLIPWLPSTAGTKKKSAAPAALKKKLTTSK